MNRDYDEVCNMGILAIVNSVRIRVKENILAIVIGEEKNKNCFLF